MMPPRSVKNSRPSSAAPNVVTLSRHRATRCGGNGTTLVSPGGRFFSPHSSWSRPVSVHLLPACGSVRCTITRPHPILGRRQSGRATAIASSGRRPA
jgi:hypothetical protein